VSQLSVAVALPVFAGSVLAVHSMVMLPGHVIAGAVLSSTVMVWTQLLLLPQSSMAVHVRVIVYSCGHPPAAVTSAYVGVTELSQLSVAVALPVLAGSVLAVHSIVTFIGQVIAGAVLSSTVMVWTQLLLLPQSSIAVQVRVIVYSCGHPPAAVTSANVGVTDISQLSVAVALPVFAGSVLAVHSIVTLDGQVMVGAWVSITVIVWTHPPTLPQSSTPVQVRRIVYSCGQSPGRKVSK
jgi:hypothetical protein